jgi:hypothetical protein
VAHMTAHDTHTHTHTPCTTHTHHWPGFPKERCAEIMVQTTTDFYHQQKPTHLKDVRSVS